MKIVIKLNRKNRYKLKKLGFETRMNGKYRISSNIKFELPCSFTSITLDADLVMGRYSYVGENFRY